MADLTEALRYDGQRVVVIGAATGMGAAAAKALGGLGASVIALDRVPIDFEVAQHVTVDLADRASIDAALEAIDGEVHSVFAAAGMADGPNVARVNFVGHRHYLERMVNEGMIGAGATVCVISSTGGLGWEGNLPLILELLETPDYEAADAWIAAHEGTDTYIFSKQAMNAYVARQAYPLLSKGIRINAVCPGPTDTPLARAHHWLMAGTQYREATGTDALTPEQMGNTMIYLNSKLASGISGALLTVDNGQIASHLAGSWTVDAPMFDRLLGPRS